MRAACWKEADRQSPPCWAHKGQQARKTPSKLTDWRWQGCAAPHLAQAPQSLRIWRRWTLRWQHGKLREDQDAPLWPPGDQKTPVSARRMPAVDSASCARVTPSCSPGVFRACRMQESMALESTGCARSQLSALGPFASSCQSCRWHAKTSSRFGTTEMTQPIELAFVFFACCKL